MKARLLGGIYILVRLFIAYCWFLTFLLGLDLAGETQSSNRRIWMFWFMWPAFIEVLNLFSWGHLGKEEEYRIFVRVISVTVLTMAMASVIYNPNWPLEPGRLGLAPFVLCIFDAWIGTRWLKKRLVIDSSPRPAS